MKLGAVYSITYFGWRGGNYPMGGMGHFENKCSWGRLLGGTFGQARSGKLPALSHKWWIVPYVNKLKPNKLLRTDSMNRVPVVIPPYQTRVISNKPSIAYIKQSNVSLGCNKLTINPWRLEINYHINLLDFPMLGIFILNTKYNYLFFLQILL